MISILDQLFKSRLFFWLCILQFIVALCIFTIVALLPADLVKTQQPDKFMHFLGNFLLFLSAYVASGGRLKLWLLGILLIPYSMLIEASQWFTLSRHVDPRDALANISGLVTGYVIAFISEWVWSKIKPEDTK